MTVNPSYKRNIGNVWYTHKKTKATCHGARFAVNPISVLRSGNESVFFVSFRDLQSVALCIIILDKCAIASSQSYNRIVVRLTPNALLTKGIAITQPDLHSDNYATAFMSDKITQSQIAAVPIG